MLPSNKTIGIIGGGQLGKMLIEAGKPWNIKYAILETENAPASSISDIHIHGELNDADKIFELAKVADVLTYEIEHININALHALEAAGKTIIPSPKILEIIQDKGLQKLFFKHHNIPTTDFELAENPAEWADKLIKLKGNKVEQFLEKPLGDGGWVNGGFFVLNKDIFNYISTEKTIWEREPLEQLSQKKQLMSYKFNGFWYAMDTLKDKNYLENLWSSGKAPWKIWR